MLLNPLTFHSPTTLREVMELSGRLEDAKILAGGTFLLNSLKLLKRKGTKTTKNVISLRKVSELKGFEADEKTLTIKALTTISEIFDSPHLTGNLAVLKTVCRNISTQPIRNMATIGGNLTCRYTWTEMGAVAIALDATLLFQKSTGEKEELSAEAFFKNAARAPGILTHVTFPKDQQSTVAYRRIRKQSEVDVPMLTVCMKSNVLNGRFNQTRVSINNGIQFAQRDHTLENFLNSEKTSPNLSQQALDHLDTSIYDTRSDDYKKHIFRVCLKDCIDEIISKSNKK